MRPASQHVHRLSAKAAHAARDLPRGGLVASFPLCRRRATPTVANPMRQHTPRYKPVHSSCRPRQPAGGGFLLSQRGAWSVGVREATYLAPERSRTPHRSAWGTGGGTALAPYPEPPPRFASRKTGPCTAATTMRHAQCIRAHHVRVVGAVATLATSRGVRRANAARRAESAAVRAGRPSHVRLPAGSGRAGSAGGGGELLRAGRGASTRRAGVATAAADADAGSLGPSEEQAFDFDRCVLKSSLPSEGGACARRIPTRSATAMGGFGVTTGYRSARRRWWRPPCSRHAPVWLTTWALRCGWR